MPRIARFYLFIISIGILGCSNSDLAEIKTSPFSHFEFEGNDIFVEHEGQSYQWIAIDTLQVETMVKLFKSEFGRDWKDYIVEDLVEGFQELNIAINHEEEFTLLDQGSAETKLKLSFTKSNREAAKDSYEENNDVSFIHAISKKEMIEDLNFLTKKLLLKSSYSGLNGYKFQEDLEKFTEALNSDSIQVKDLGIFLSRTIGKIGDRHAYVTGYKVDNTKYLPFITAPFEGKIVALAKAKEGFRLMDERFPFLKSIDGILVEDFIDEIILQARLAPVEAKLKTASLYLNYLDRNFQIIDRPLPEVVKYVFTNLEGEEKTIALESKVKEEQLPVWKEKFAQFIFENDDLDKLGDFENYFKIIDVDIAYAMIPDMVDPEEAPKYYQAFNEMFQSIDQTKALIVDIRSNDGGSRDMIFELAKYLIYPDSIHVVNVAQTRGEVILGSSKSLHVYEYLNVNEKGVVDKFLDNYDPIYQLDDSKYSDNYYCLLNGSKLSKKGYHYNRPIYILMNESCFSASTVLATIFKDLPNISLVGTTTDGSSGNSETFMLPNSMLLYNISTMVSFQKDGNILDGYGTKPDIEIPRSLDQILWKEDFQLESLIERINAE